MCWRAAAASCPATARASRAACSPATWELDLWGRVRYGRAAASAQAASAQADYAYARESIAALVAKSWFLATELGLQTEAARDTIRANEDLVRLAGDRARIGVGNEADVYVGARDGRHLPRPAARARARTQGRRFARSNFCSAATLPPLPRSRRGYRASPARCRRGCRRSCSNGGRTSSPRSAASRRRSTGLARPRPRACRRSR